MEKVELKSHHHCLFLCRIDKKKYTKGEVKKDGKTKPMKHFEKKFTTTSHSKTVRLLLLLLLLLLL